MIRGIIAGKFLPPHLGHSFLISRAAQQCDQLTVLICDRPEYGIDATLRQSWLREMHPAVDFLIIKDNMDDNDSATWAASTTHLLGYVPDVVFSSEDYGVRWAYHLGCRHVSVDKMRIHVPISATKVRANTWVEWQYLHPIVRTYFTKRICIVGAESTGTTTLSQALAQHFQTNWVPEYGRAYTINQKTRLDRDGWQDADFMKIAREQNRSEDAAAAESNKLLFCDTDSFATSIWYERYLKLRSAKVEALAANRRYDLYLLTDVNIPFIQDGYRDGKDIRSQMHQRFQEKLLFWNKPYVVVSGSQSQRLAQASTLIDSLLADSAVQLPGLVRNSWHPTSHF